MAPRPSTRTDPERVHERSPDPQEGANRPLEEKGGSVPPGTTPYSALNNPVGEIDPASDADPYAPPPVDEAPPPGSTR